MKKILLGTTTLVGVALFAGAAFAGETPKVTIGGFADFQVGITGEDQDSATSVGGSKRAGAFRNETELDVKIDGKTDNGLGYGAMFDLAVSGTNDADNQGGNGSTNARQINHSYVYVDGAWGRFQGGADYGVTHTMKVDAASIARATGGIDGDFRYFMTQTSGAVLAAPDLMLDYGSAANQLGDESFEAINKVSYYTPRFAGFQAGISYLFNSNNTNRGISVNRSDQNNTATAENIFLGGLNWEGKFDQVSLAAAATGEWGDAQACATTAGGCTAGQTIYNDLRTWNVGAKAGYMGFSVAGSYGSYGDSLRVKTVAGDSGTHYWTLGAAYEMGAFGASVTWLDSEVDLGATHNDFNNLSVGVDYKLAPGFTPYAEVSFVETDIAGGITDDNDATVFIAGTQLAF